MIGFEAILENSVLFIEKKRFLKHATITYQEKAGCFNKKTYIFIKELNIYHDLKCELFSL